jgi:hypothetical protein
MPLIGGYRFRGTAEPKASNTTEADGPDLSDRRRVQQDDQCSHDRDRSAFPIGAEGARHPPHCLGHDCDGDQLETVKKT